MESNNTLGSDPQVQHVDVPLVRLFVALQLMGGNIGLPITVLTILFSKRVSRHVTFLNFCITWIISSICYLLLTYAGKQYGPQPGFGLCLTQASLIYGAPVLTAVSSCALVAQMWFAAKYRPGGTQKERKWRRIRDYTFIVLPYFLFVIIVLVSGAYGFHNPRLVSRASSSMYCVIRNRAIGTTSAAIAVVLTLIGLGFEAALGKHIIRNWRAFRSGKGGTSINFVARIALFSVFVIMAVCVAFIFIANLQGSIPNLFLAILPTAAWIVFGTQEDLLKVWVFWHTSTPIRTERLGSSSSISSTAVLTSTSGAEK